MRIIVVGTGTEIGKTHVSTCLLAWARRHGRRGAAYKPIASGIEGRCDDAERHAAALGAPYVHPTFAYRRPVSPHLAAREEGPAIDLAAVRLRAGELQAGVDFLLVESAGGLFSPLTDTATNVQLVEHLLPACVLLVAPDCLGVLHDVGACVRAARAAGLSISAVVLSAPASADASTGTNARELARVGLGPVAGAFPHASVDSEVSQAVAGGVWAALDPLTAP